MDLATLLELGLLAVSTNDATMDPKKYVEASVLTKMKRNWFRKVLITGSGKSNSSYKNTLLLYSRSLQASSCYICHRAGCNHSTSHHKINGIDRAQQCIVMNGDSLRWVYTMTIFSQILNTIVQLFVTTLSSSSRCGLETRSSQKFSLNLCECFSNEILLS